MIHRGRAEGGPNRVIRIGLLMHGLDRPLSGVTRVALELGRALQRSRECEVIFLTTYLRGPFRNGTDARVTYLPGCERVPGLMALGGPLTALAARRFRLDLVHDPVGVSPFTLGRSWGSFRRVLTIHDAIAFRYPEGYSWSNNLLHRRYVPATLRHVDGVITVSDHSRADLQRFLRLSPDRVWVVPNGVSEDFRPIDPPDALRVATRYGLSRPYILYVGSGHTRKNLKILVASFGRLRVRLPEYQLALVGPPRSLGDRLDGQSKHAGLSNHVRFLGPIPDEDLPAIYSAARLFVFPSLLEGFGLPVLEAMACGTPVVCSNATSLPEIAGEAALLTDAGEPETLGDAMLQVLTDPSLADSLRTRGFARARQFTWDRAAQATVNVYRSVLATSSRAGSIPGK